MQVNKQNQRDTITGLYTRSIMDELDIKFSQRNTIWSVVIVDIDHFKLVNDVFGHLEGDRVIRRVSNILERNVRTSDTLLRYGGDEFVVVMPATEQLKAVNQAERILDSFLKEVFPEGIEISLSIGVAGSTQDDNNLNDTLQKADKALYEAKQNGRGQVSFYPGEDASEAKQKISFEHFVGRNNELAELRSILNDTVKGTGHFTLITGKAGIGKSRLAQELQHYSSFKNCLFLETRCDIVGADKPYRLLTMPILKYLKSNKNIVSNFPEFLPQTADLFPGLDLRVTQTHKNEIEGTTHLKIYSEVTAILNCISSTQPIIFLIDNLHWISEHDLDFLAYLSRATTDSKILFLTTARPLQQYKIIDKKIRILASIVNFKEIELSELNEKLTRHMVMFALRDPKTPAAILKRLTTQCGGNPLYLRELLLSLKNSGAIQPSSGKGWKYLIPEKLPLPETIAQLMAARIENTKSSVKEVLKNAALMTGGNLSVAPLCSVLDKDELEIAQALELAFEDGILQKNSENALEYQFTHETMRNYLHQNLSTGMQKALELRFGQYYEKHEASMASKAAYHYCNSTNSKKARHFALIAMEQACESDANYKALHWLEKYMSFEAEEDPSDAFKVRLKLAELHTLFANHTEATEYINQAEKFALSQQDTAQLLYAKAKLYQNIGNNAESINLHNQVIKLLPVGTLRKQARLNLMLLKHLAGERDELPKMFNEIHNEIQSLPENDEKKLMLATYYSRHGSIAIDTPINLRINESLEAAKLFREVQDKTGEALAFTSAATVMLSTTRFQERIEILNDALKIFKQIGNTHSTMTVYINLGQAHQASMSYAVARDYYEQCLDLVKATGVKRFAAWAYDALGTIDWYEKKFDSAELNYKKAIDVTTEVGLKPMTAGVKMNLISLFVTTEKFEQADIHLSELENSELLKSMSETSIRMLQGYRGTERFFNTGIDRATALSEAEESLKKATSKAPEFPRFAFITLLITLAQCLHESNKIEESKATITKAQNFFNNYIASIDNDASRKANLESDTAHLLNEVVGLLLPEQTQPGKLHNST